MNSATLEYKQKVWRFLEEMKTGERYSIYKLSKPETREMFVDAIKEYMASLPYDGWINFNSDYTKIYKTEAVPWKILEEGFKK